MDASLTHHQTQGAALPKVLWSLAGVALIGLLAADHEQDRDLTPEQTAAIHKDGRAGFEATKTWKDRVFKYVAPFNEPIALTQALEVHEEKERERAKEQDELLNSLLFDN